MTPLHKSEGVNGFSSALRAIQDQPFMLSTAYGDQLGRPLREGAHEKIRLFENRMITRMQNLLVPMYCHCMVRTLAEQRGAFVRGNSKNDGSKPYPHMAWAVDIVHGVKQWDLSRESWALIGHIGKEVSTQNGIRIVWGGDFKSIYDPAHWELKDWRGLAKA